MFVHFISNVFMKLSSIIKYINAFLASLTIKQKPVFMRHWKLFLKATLIAFKNEFTFHLSQKIKKVHRIYDISFFSLFEFLYLSMQLNL